MKDLGSGRSKEERELKLRAVVDLLPSLADDAADADDAVLHDDRAVLWRAAAPRSVRWESIMKLVQER